MNLQAIYFPDSDSSAPDGRLMKLCKEAHLDVQVRERLPSLDDFASTLPDEPRLLLLPTIQQDCLGIKLAQIAQGMECAHRVLLYSQQGPTFPYLAQAMRSGVGEVLVLEDDSPQLSVQLRRAFRTTQEFWSQTQLSRAHAAALDETRGHLELALRDRDRMEERCVGLAETAMRLAAGDLSLEKKRPRLLLISESNARAASVTEVAEHVHFVVDRARTGELGVQSATKLTPDVVVCDGELSDMDAPTFAGKLRRALGKQPVYVVAWSSSLQTSGHLLAPGSGIDDLIPKTAGSLRNLLGGALLAALR